MKLVSKNKLEEKFERWDMETEKHHCFTAAGIIVHNSNCRVGLVLDSNDEGNPEWTWMAGSHGVRRKEFVNVTHRFRVPELIEQGLFVDAPKIDDVFYYRDYNWRVTSIIEPKPESEEQFLKVQVTAVDDRPVPHCQDILRRSEYWEPLTDNVKDMILHIKDKHFPEPQSVIVYAEIFGAGVQDMVYGLTNRSFRVFDIAINNRYIDFDDKKELCDKFNVPMVPVLYRGPFSVEKLEEFTNGPTTMCAIDKAGKFSGREGIVVTPIKEVEYCSVVKGRRIIKSVSADYLARKGGTEFH